jgi:hemerythrin-like domain-containing protein
MRKTIYRPGAFMDIFVQVGQSKPLKEKGEELEEEEASPLEDLMKEHGFVERILIIYQRMIDMAVRGQGVDVSAINGSANMIRDYINNHHERDEERYIFPKFKEANYIVDIVDTLQAQHDQSRKIAKELINLSARGENISMDDRKRMMSLCGDFVYMYLAHIAHENTILFPTFYDIASNEYIQDIRERMEEEEEKVLGETGFRGIVGRLSELEKRVGSYDLNQFTPQA